MAFFNYFKRIAEKKKIYMSCHILYSIVQLKPVAKCFHKSKHISRELNARNRSYCHCSRTLGLWISLHTQVPLSKTKTFFFFCGNSRLNSQNDIIVAWRPDWCLYYTQKLVEWKEKELICWILPVGVNIISCSNRSTIELFPHIPSSLSINLSFCWWPMMSPCKLHS